MFKGSGITKSNKRKWNDSLEMEPKDIVLNKSRASRSALDDVEEDVHFVINSDFNFATSIPDRKSIDLPRKTYSKKSPLLIHPFMSSDMLDPFRDSLAAKDRLQSPLTLKCSPAVTAESKPPKKQKKDSDSLNDTRTLLPRKFQKRNPAQSCNAKVPRLPRSKSLGSTPMNNEEASSDSDIEIVGVYNKSSAPSKVSNLKKLTNGQAQFSNKKNSRAFESSVGSQVIINEADIAPFMPANPTVYPDTSSRANSMRWLSANGEISITSFEPNCFMGDEAARSKSADSGKKPMFLPEMKSEINKKPKGKRELKSLYNNLNEISWAHETSFKNLLRNPDATKGKGRIGKTGKNLRNLKPTDKLEKLSGKRAAKIKASQLMARKKSKMARLNHKAKAIGKNKSTVMETMKKKRLGKQVVNKVNKKKEISKTKLNSGTKGIESDTNEETDILYSLPEPPIVKVEMPDTKPKINVGKTKLDPSKMKNSTLKIKHEVPKVKSSMLKLKSEAQKTKSNIYKLKPDALKQKSSLLKFKPDDSVRKTFIAQVKPEHSPPSTSGLQKVSFSAKSTSKNCSKNSDVKDFLEKFDDNFEFSREVQLLQGLLNENEHLYSAVQNGSKLRVSLQPLEHTNLWTSEFYDDFRRHFLDQALRRAVENRDRDSIAVMYQELLESFANAQSGNVGNIGSSRTAKRRRLGDEEALRSSVRQSEGAFRYKEIVVKKHPNYMQVVLVPNEVKQNCLTVEAMKELKDAFLLAKKDPNCNAVLLNSSGKYFCTGLDLSPLVGANKKQAAEDLSNTVRDLVMTLGMFTKPVIAAVNGTTIGFGVSLLTYCDVVLASDKATFCFPAAKIGYIPEGGVTLTLPQVVGSSVASEMLLQGRRLTAEQAFRYGLVSEVLWPTKLMNEVIPRLKAIISQPLTAMEATKAMVRYHLWDKLKSHVDRERRLLCEHWLGPRCQANIKSLIQTGWTAD